jgi:hypothetical protein
MSVATGRYLAVCDSRGWCLPGASPVQARNRAEPAASHGRLPEPQ